MLKIAIQHLEGGDSFKAIEFLVGHDDPLQAVHTFDALQKHFYWEKKDLPLSVAMGRAGIQHGLAEAAKLQGSDAKLAAELRSVAKGMAYDIGSFTWPGWDEPGIDIGPSDVAVGLDAAKVNLRLAIELEKPDGPMARAWWLLGAHQLAAGDRTEARASFRKGIEFSKSAGNRGDELLGLGYIQVTDLLDQPDDPAAKAEFERVKSELAKLKEDGEFFVSQLETVLRVFDHKQ